MQSNTIAAEVVARLAAEPGRRLAPDDLARLCGRAVAEVEAACALLRRWEMLNLDGDGKVALRPGPGKVAPTSLVLVVENTPAVAHVVGALLESEGYPVLIANALQTALGVVEGIGVELVIADSFASNARQALERLRPLRDAAKPAPVMLFTGHRDLDENAVRAAGYAGLLPKPFDIDELLARVDDVVHAHNESGQ